MTDYLLHHNANTHWHFPTSLETDAALDEARRALADFLNARPNEIAFGNNMTSLTFHVARGLGREWGPGDEIVLTELDHHANVAPWQALARERGVTIRTVGMHVETGQLDWAAMEAAVGPRTRLVADWRRLERARHHQRRRGRGPPRPRGGRAAVRGCRPLRAARAGGRRRAGLRSAGVLGLQVLRTARRRAVRPPRSAVAHRRPEARARRPRPRRSGSKPARRTTRASSAPAAAIDFLASLDRGSRRRAAGRRSNPCSARCTRAVRSSSPRLYDGLAAIPGVRVYGPAPDQPRTPTVAFVVKDRTSDEVARELVSRGLFLSNGDFYATSAIARLGHCARRRRARRLRVLHVAGRSGAPA